MTVCIFGNNLTALTLAKTLVNHKINVDLLSSKKNYKIDSSRTIGIANNNINFFNKNIINIEKIIWKIKRIEIFSDNLKKEKLIEFKANKDYLFSIVKNNKLYQLLEKDLSKNKFFSSKFSNDKNISFLDKYELIINCDSSNFITNRYFSKKIIKEYNSNAYTTVISHDQISNDTAVQIFTKKGPLAFLPISNRETSVVYSVHNSNDSKDENIEQLIKDKNFKYKIKNIEKIQSFQLKSLNLRSYYHDNILAFGDLLHKVHPLAGQGFNMTIRDTKILLEIIKKKLDVGLSLDSSVNLDFQKKLKHKNFIFSNGVDLIHEFFNLERKMKTSFMSKSVKFISSYPSLNKMFTKIADRGVLF
ncbi:FAD-dependent monooxygenase [Candidatus Pelagibacter bacterium nBUS_28]|uniref:FAD-dependent monooxygenase n=1 Tax=Candidatus Pelagibacter bacterium nBUS_28 TaxID=3374189 RepID=UPI003EBA3D52